MSHAESQYLDNVPDNPVRRLCEVNGWPLEYLARTTKVSRNVVYFVTRGMQTNIPPALHHFFIENLGDKYNAAEMNDKYQAWRLVKQSAARLNPFTPYTLADRKKDNTHPLSSYLLFYEMTVLGFCEEIALPKSVFYNYVNNSQLSMPRSLYQALLTAGVKKEEILLLDKMSREFYDRMRKQNAAEIREINDYRKFRE